MLSPEMFSFVKKKEKCRRKLLKQLYGDASEETLAKSCLCCDICLNDCTCNNGEHNAIPFSSMCGRDEIQCQLEREMTNEMIIRLETHLL